MLSCCILLSVLLFTPASCVQDANIPTSDISMQELEAGDRVVLKNLSEQIQNLNEEIIILEGAIENLRAEAERERQFQFESYQTAMQSVNTSISGVQSYLTTVGIVVGLAAVIAAITGISLSRQLTRNKSEVDRICETCEEIQEKTRKLNEEIETNIDSLYERLRMSELNYLLDRLNRVPEDINNLFSRLASQDIPSKFYKKLKNAYLSHTRPFTNPNNKSAYLSLFFQHFPTQALFDPDIESDLEQNYSLLFDFSFNREIEDNSKAFFIEAARRGFSIYADRVRKYFRALGQRNFPFLGSRDEFASSEELHSAIYKLLSKDQKFELCDLLCDEEIQPFTRLYGKFLLQEYDDKSPDNTPEQAELIQKIRSIIGEEND